MEKEVYILGGGPSLSHFNFSNLINKDVIAVNKSILDYPNSTYFITVDFTFLRKVNIHQIRRSTATKVFVACLHFPYMQEIDGTIRDTLHKITYDLSDFDIIIKSRACDGMGFSFKDFRNGLNSGFCALQLAVLLGYEVIHLLGFDLCCSKDTEKTHYHNGYNQVKSQFEQTLNKYLVHFTNGLQTLRAKRPDIQVISHSEVSKLNYLLSYKPFN